MAEPTLIERLTELANQLGGHAGPSDTVELSEFLTKCEKEAFAIATELHRLERHSLPGGAEAVRDVPPHGWVIKMVHAVFVDDTFTHDKRVRDAAIARGCYVTPVWASSLSAAKAALAASPPPSVWMGIDTAPKDGTEVLLFAPTLGTPVGDLTSIIVIGFWVTDWNGVELGWDTSLDDEPLNTPEFTHWQPLPPPPQQEGK